MPVEDDNGVFKFEKDFVFEIGQDKFHQVIMFIVYEAQTQKLLCWNSFQLKYIREGYRVVPLLDEYLNRVQNANLLAKIKIK